MDNLKEPELIRCLSIARLRPGDIIQEGGYEQGFTQKTVIKVYPKHNPTQKWRRILVDYGDGKPNGFTVSDKTKFNIVIRDKELK